MKNIYSLLSLIAVGLIIFEIVIVLITKKKLYNFGEAIINLGTGIINQCMNLAVMALVLFSYGKLYDNYAFNVFEKNWVYYLSLLIAIDFLFYWYHRWNHERNFLWAAHSPHHSSEEFNFSVAARASLTQRLFSFTMYWPLALIGFEPIDIYTMSGVHLIIGFTHHTRVIGKLWWPIEYIFNTPSHHRVHHGTNEKYLDKNYSEVLIIWDRMFGTFQVEDEPVRYGILRHPMSHSAMAINFHFWGLLWQDCKETKSWWNKIRLWFMPLGWRPDDVKTYREPVRAIEYGEKKLFNVPLHPKSHFFLMTQVTMAIILMFSIISIKFELNTIEKIIYSAILFYNVESWKYVLDYTRKSYLHITLSSILVALCHINTGLVQNVFQMNSALISVCVSMITLAYFLNQGVSLKTQSPSQQLHQRIQK